MTREWDEESLLIEVVRPSIERMFTPDELEQVVVQISQDFELFLADVHESIRPTVRARARDQDGWWYLRVALGRDVHRHYLLCPPATDDMTADELGLRLRDSLQDFIAESSFGWGQLRPID